MADPVTVGEMFQNIIKLFPKKTALCFKDTGDSDWRELNFTEYYSFTTQAARSLLKVYNSLILHHTLLSIHQWDSRDIAVAAGNQCQSG
jgi:hypothetical protein